MGLTDRRSPLGQPEGDRWTETTKQKTKTMKTKDQILENSDIVTVVNDGQVRYPVLTSSLEEWTRKNGPITTANYEQFCAEVECLGERQVGTPGSDAMTDLCAELIADGADVARPT
jgi:uncharacterized protein YbcC (UPF0753/DUF2309 family)